MIADQLKVTSLKNWGDSSRAQVAVEIANNITHKEMPKIAKLWKVPKENNLHVFALSLINAVMGAS